MGDRPEEGMDLALEPPPVQLEPGAQYATETRQWQGDAGHRAFARRPAVGHVV